MINHSKSDNANARHLRTQSATAPAWAVGEWAFCTVHGAEGWCKVTAIRPRDGYLKITGFGPWCPPFNFTHTDTQGRGHDE